MTVDPVVAVLLVILAAVILFGLALFIAGQRRP